ncbi:metallothionein-like protein 1 [Cornus florida]|uniref:metallothionein-like protein 1 n=1 Tax=Cornus florida TaxID=4283 RepID=UPI0028A1F54D|nr:metallothionein-like protein 1 [Cornus florida]
MSSGCNCGSGCSCGADCKCGKMYPDLETKTTSTATIITGVAPKNTYAEGSEMSFGAEGGHTCKCGDKCTCDPCTC